MLHEISLCLRKMSAASDAANSARVTWSSCEASKEACHGEGEGTGGPSRAGSDMGEGAPVGPAPTAMTGVVEAEVPHLVTLIQLYRLEVLQLSQIP